MGRSQPKRRGRRGALFAGPWSATPFCAGGKGGRGRGFGDWERRRQGAGSGHGSQRGEAHGYVVDLFPNWDDERSCQAALATCVGNRIAEEFEDEGEAVGHAGEGFRHRGEIRRERAGWARKKCLRGRGDVRCIETSLGWRGGILFLPRGTCVQEMFVRPVYPSFQKTRV